MPLADLPHQTDILKSCRCLLEVRLWLTACPWEFHDQHWSYSTMMYYAHTTSTWHMPACNLMILLRGYGWRPSCIWPRGTTWGRCQLWHHFTDCHHGIAGRGGVGCLEFGCGASRASGLQKNDKFGSLMYMYLDYISRLCILIIYLDYVSRLYI